MASNCAFFAFAMLFLQSLSVEIGSAQQYSYETPNFAGKYALKQLELAKPLLNNVADLLFNHALKQSIGSKNVSECIKAVLNGTGDPIACMHMVHFH